MHRRVSWGSDPEVFIRSAVQRTRFPTSGFNYLVDLKPLGVFGEQARQARLGHLRLRCVSLLWVGY